MVAGLSGPNRGEIIIYRFKIPAPATRKPAFRRFPIAALLGTLGLAPLAPGMAQNAAPIAQIPAAPVVPAPVKITIPGPLVIVMTTDRSVVPAVLTTTITKESSKKDGLAPIKITSPQAVTVSSDGDTKVVTTTVGNITTTTITVSSATAQTTLTTPAAPGLKIDAPPTPGAIVEAAGTQTSEAARSTYALALQLARESVKAKLLEPAEKNAQTALAAAQTPKERAKALTLLGGIYQARQMYPQAEAQWATLAALPDPDDADDNRLTAAMARAQTFTAQGQTDAAIAQYRLMETLSEAGTDAGDKEKSKYLLPFLKALTYFKAEQFALAQAQFKGALAVGEKRVDADFFAIALLASAEISVLQKDYPQALSSYQRLLKFAPDNETLRNLTHKFAQEQIALLAEGKPSPAQIKALDDDLRGDNLLKNYAETFAGFFMLLLGADDD